MRDKWSVPHSEAVLGVEGGACVPSSGILYRKEVDPTGTFKTDILPHQPVLLDLGPYPAPPAFHVCLTYVQSPSVAFYIGQGPCATWNRNPSITG